MVSEPLAPVGKKRLSLVKGKKRPRQSSCDMQADGIATSVQIREIRTREEKERLYRFRYQLSGGDINRASDSRKRIKDDLDIDAVNLVALFESEVIGTIRINYAWRCALGLHADFYRMREAAGADHPTRTCVLSRLLVRPNFRHGALGYRLMAEAYKHALTREACFAFLHCQDALIYYFSVLGFKAYMGRTMHRDFGEVIPMKLALLDEQYLMQIGSPLLPVLRAWKQSEQSSIAVVPG